MHINSVPLCQLSYILKVVHRVRLELTESSLEERRTNHYANDAWRMDKLVSCVGVEPTACRVETDCSSFELPRH